MSDLEQIEEKKEVQGEKPIQNKKKWLPVIAIGLVVVACIFGYMQHQKGVLYEQAQQYCAAGNYKEAIPIYEELKDYKDSQDQLLEARYCDAVQMLDQGTYVDAIAVFEELGDYSETQAYLEKARMAQKYSAFNKIYFDWAGESGEAVSIEDAERILKKALYKTWYNQNDNTELVIDAYTIGGKPYLIKEGCYDWYENNIWFKFSYLDEPEVDNNINYGIETLPYIGEEIQWMGINLDIEQYYYSVTLEEYDALYQREAEEYAKRPMYSDSEIISKAANMLKSKVGGYYSGAERIYHTVSHSDEYVEYDWATKTYTCTMTCAYNTNVFDIYGTSKQSYYVTAVFKDTGSGLSVVKFSAY